MYIPKPADLDGITVPDPLGALTEKLAENVHEVWAFGRVSEGWQYGERKDSEKKTTPLLVPYSELPENEKEYDRRTAMDTIKLIMKLGYSINGAETPK